MDVTWTHTIQATIDPAKLADVFAEEWADYQKRKKNATMLAFAHESAEMMGEDFFDGPWCVIEVEDSEFSL